MQFQDVCANVSGAVVGAGRADCAVTISSFCPASTGSTHTSFVRKTCDHLRKAQMRNIPRLVWGKLRLRDGSKEPAATEERTRQRNLLRRFWRTAALFWTRGSGAAARYSIASKPARGASTSRGPSVRSSSCCSTGSCSVRYSQLRSCGVRKGTAGSALQVSYGSALVACLSGRRRGLTRQD